MAADIFISYRWGHTSNDAARLLASELQRRLGERCVYIDVERRSLGGDLRAHIQDELKSARILLVAIHPEWIEAIPRLNEINDLVRLEIEAALEFGLTIVPVLLGGASVPKTGDLPPSIQRLGDFHFRPVAQNASYGADMDRLANDLGRELPNLPLRALSQIANISGINITLALMLAGALMLFISRMLNIHIIRFSPEVSVAIGNRDPQPPIRIIREGGLLMAWNWVAVVLVITPVMFHLFSDTLRIARQLLESLQVKKMIYYIGHPGLETPATARELWESVARPTSIWCQAFTVAFLILGVVQWAQYSGQWYFFHGHPLKIGAPADLQSFLRISTGPDWNVAWALGLPDLALSGGAIAIFALLMYLLYGVGTTITYSYYAFLFNFSAELSQLATSAGARSSTTLRLDVSDREAGGLGAFRRIQGNHAAFCFWTLLAMYLMSLRNAFLPLDCHIPQGVANALSDGNAVAAQCASMETFALNIYYSMVAFLRGLWSGHPDFGILFFTYSQSNTFVLGSVLWVIVITSFFFLISNRFRTIVDAARHDTDGDVAKRLLRQITFENVRVITIMALGALAVMFLNLGPLVLVVAVALFIGDYTFSFASRGRHPRTN